MKPRWPDWQPTDEQVEDWVMWLHPFTWESAKNAVREHAGSQTYNKRPNPAKLRALLAKYQPQKEEEKGHPEDTVFVMYEGGGPTKRLAGFYMPVVVKPHEQHLLMKAAENLRKWHEDHYGGIWKIYERTTNTEMSKMRFEFHKARVG